MHLPPIRAAAILIALMMLTPAYANTKGTNHVIKTGLLLESQTWSGNIHVTGDVIIPADVTVTIKPGTSITFSKVSDYDADTTIGRHAKDKKCNIIVKGTLKAVGKKDNKISFGLTKEEPDNSDRWGGIVFLGASASILSNCNIEDAVFGIALLNDNTLKVERSMIQRCNIGIYCAERSGGQIHSTVISKCNNGIEATDSSFPTIEYCYITDNEWGVSFSGMSTPIIRNNQIEGNDLGISGNSDGEALIKENEIKNNKVGVQCSSEKTALINNKISSNTVGLEHKALQSPKMLKNQLLKNNINVKIQ